MVFTHIPSRPLRRIMEASCLSENSWRRKAVLKFVSKTFSVSKSRHIPLVTCKAAQTSGRMTKEALQNHSKACRKPRGTCGSGAPMVLVSQEGRTFTAKKGTGDASGGGGNTRSEGRTVRFPWLRTFSKVIKFCTRTYSFCASCNKVSNLPFSLSANSLLASHSIPFASLEIRATDSRPIFRE